MAARNKLHSSWCPLVYVSSCDEDIFSQLHFSSFTFQSASLLQLERLQDVFHALLVLIPLRLRALHRHSHQPARS